VPGSAKIAADLNQAVANNARRFLFHHPSDDPLAGLALPSPGHASFPAPRQPPSSHQTSGPSPQMAEYTCCGL
jgi:hypothetical protein